MSLIVYDVCWVSLEEIGKFSSAFSLVVHLKSRKDIDSDSDAKE